MRHRRPGLHPSDVQGPIQVDFLHSRRNVEDGDQLELPGVQTEEEIIRRRKGMVEVRLQGAVGATGATLYVELHQENARQLQAVRRTVQKDSLEPQRHGAQIGPAAIRGPNVCCKYCGSKAAGEADGELLLPQLQC